MAASLWQHSMTLLGVVGFIVAGDDGAERAESRRGGKKLSAKEQQEISRAWEESGAPWRLKSPPKHTPEEEERRKLAAISKLMKVGRMNAEATRNRPRGRRRRSAGQPEAAARAHRSDLPADLDPDQDPEVAALMSQLLRADKIRDGQE